VPVTARAFIAPVIGTVLLLASCRSLDRFDTKGDGAYCGPIVGVPLFADGFIPDNEKPKLSLELEIDVDRLATRPGTITSSDVSTGLCSKNGEPLFRDAPLRAIEEILHDALAQAEFGDGHQHDFFAWVDSTCQGTMLAVVSFLTNGDVEVRLLKPAADPPEGASAQERPGFAKFYLKKQNTRCTF
jgi:hypothetical protein